MTIKTSVEPIDRDIAVWVDEMTSVPAQQKVIADFARDQLQAAEVVNRSILGRVPPHTTMVNGVASARLEGINPQSGSILFEFALIEDVLMWIGEALVARSPVRSGAYRQGHTLFADGIEIPLGGVVPPAAEYTFSNYLPYAHKIEIGKTESGRDFTIQVPNRIYERTATDARAQFGNRADISFTYLGIVGGRQVNPLSGRGVSGRRGRAAHNITSARFPTIIVRLPGA